MNDVKQWCMLISAVSIVSGIIMSIIPESKLKKVYNCLVTVLLVYVFILPLIKEEKYDFDFKSYLKQNEEVSKEFSDKSFLPAESVINSEIGESIERRLKENGFDADCTVKCTVGQNNFSVDKITVLIADDFSKNEIINDILKEYTTALTKIEFVGDKNE